MSWSISSTQGTFHDKALVHGANRWSLLNNGGRIGYGKGATGGLYGPEIQVTSLADGSGNGPAGSLREAMHQTGAKWITFKPGMTAPNRSTWKAPYNNAPLSAWDAKQIFLIYGTVTTSGETTIDGRGDSYSTSSSGGQFQNGNCVLAYFTIDFSQWWASNLSDGNSTNIWDATAAYSTGMQPIQKTGASVNGEVYWNISSNLNNTRGYGDRDWWFDHLTLQGVRYGDGAPGFAKSATLWDFNDGGHAICYLNHHVTYSWTHFADCNKSSIAGCSSSPTANEINRYCSGWITEHHNWFEGGLQRQPLIRGGTTWTDTNGRTWPPFGGNVHVFSNYYTRPGTPPNKGQIIVADPHSCIFYEGNLADSLGWSTCPLALSRDATGFIIGHQGESNVVKNGMTIPSDHGSLTFAPTDEYAYDASELRVLGQTAFANLITTGAGA